MTHLSDQQIEKLLVDNGFSPKDVPTFVAIAHAESGGNTDAVNHNTNGSTDIGLFQINTGGGFDRALLTDPNYNTQAAYALFSQRGTEPWNSSKSRWSQELSSNPAKVTVTQPASPVQKLGDFFTNPNKYFTKDTSIASGFSGMVDAITGWLGEGAKYFALFIMGLIFLVVGFVLIFRKPLENTAKVALP